jgi:alkylation response protein AidB-like acyl-CoA dehydrogenase
MINPGLQKYDLSEYKGLKNRNFYKEDSTLKRVINKFLQNISPDEKESIENHIIGYGELVGGILNDLTDKSHKEGKYGEIQKYNSVGKRVDDIIYSPEQIQSRKISYEYGVVNLDFHKHWKYPFHATHRYALAYLMNLNGEGGVSCPLAMTDGLIYALKHLGSEDQKKKYLPLVAGETSKSHFFAGQYVTERVGGSNVGANRTSARKLESGKWILNGEKWFCSNPGDLWVTTAKIEDSTTIGLFLVSRFKESGELNGHHLLRKKDIIGSRGKITAEAIYEDVEAEELGRPSHGLVNLIRYIITISRLHVGIGACGNSRRAVMEAIEYAKHRTAYGKSLTDFFIYEKTLCELQITQTALTFSNFRSIFLWETNHLSANIIIPLMKYISSSVATSNCHTAILCLGGNGIVGDFSPLPRLLNDSIINESWEGTHFLLTDHILKALDRKKFREAFFEECYISNESLQKLSENVRSAFKEKKQSLLNYLDLSPERKDALRMSIANTAYDLFSLSLLIREVETDFNNKVSDSIYILMTELFSEMIQQKKGGDFPIGSKIYDKKNRTRIINY